MRRLIYVFDAYCPWCYAFTPVVRRLHEAYRDRFEFEVLSGGMVVDEAKFEGGDEASAALRRAYERITELTGARFGEAFFLAIKARGAGEGSRNVNSEIPARAVACFRENVPPGIVLEFIDRLMTAFFVDGADPVDEGTYKSLALQFGLDPERFVSDMNSPRIHDLARYDFALVKQLRVEGFPRLFLQTSESYFHLVARGYTPYERVDQIVKEILE